MVQRDVPIVDLGRASTVLAALLGRSRFSIVDIKRI